MISHFIRYKLKCKTTGFLEAHGYWATRGWPSCKANPTKRRKRWMEFPSLQPDIDYSIYAFYEAQFMWSDKIEESIYARTTLEPSF